MTQPQPTSFDLDTPYSITEAQITRFREDGFVKLPNVFTAEELAYFGDAVTRVVHDRNAQKNTPMEQRDTYGKAFIQVGEVWTHDPDAARLTLSKRLGKIAAELLGTSGVRLYHDQGLYKEAGGGFTPWHVDQQYWPLTTGLCVTAWIPLQAVPMDMGPLQFGKGSHVKNIGRELAISDESERLIREAIKREGLIESMEPYAEGEISFHYGWTLHRAGPNTTDMPRKVHTVIYMDKDMKMSVPDREPTKNDAKKWCPGINPGEVIASPINPIIFEA